MDKKGTHKFQILSLDGGGMKGLFSAAFLAKLEDDLHIRIVDHFDLIVGTSTGGIIAIGLGLGLSPKQLVELYFNEGANIFKQSPWSGLKHIIFNKYSGADIESVLRKETCFGEKLLGESKKRLVIPTYNLDSDDVYIFKTAHHERFKGDYKVPAWKVARATSAAPSFFPISRNVDSIRLVDGGVWANNPTMVGLIESMAILEIPLETIQILSIGTTDELKRSPKVFDMFGGWAFWLKTIATFIMQAQSISISAQVKLLLQDRYQRINPKVPKGLFGLDKMNLNELFAFAATHSRDFAPTFTKIFQGHKADEFIPVHELGR